MIKYYESLCLCTMTIPFQYYNVCGSLFPVMMSIDEGEVLVLLYVLGYLGERAKFYPTIIVTKNSLVFGLSAIKGKEYIEYQCFFK